MLAGLDLNLLLVLHAVLTERSVARAAARLHVTPSAVSNALARLRAALGDRLVTRVGRGIAPTPRALELAPALARTLGELERAVAGVRFDPAHTTRTYTLGIAEPGQLAWLPRITARLRVAMPRARLRVVSIDSMLALGDLASPEVDLHVGVPATGPGIHAEPLTRERTVLVARRRHPAAGKRLSPTALGALAHVVVQLLPGRGLRDHATAAYDRAGIARDVVVAVPSFTAAAAIAAGTELVATIPQSILATHGRRLGLVALRTPLPETSVPIALCWHERTDDDPAARALRELVRAAITAAR